MANTVRVAVQATGTRKASSELDQLRDKFEKLQKGGAKGFAVTGGAVAAGVALGGLAMAAGAVIGVLGDAAQAAMDEEVSIQRLNTALTANVKGFNGNTDAIEKVLKARMKLGFSDDEQRESLALLVARTGNVTKALGIQQVAMDLARLKGIGLAEASKAIALGMAGSGRALKELGINVKDLSGETEILTAIQNKAAGQAKAYAETTSGQLLVSQVKVGEAMEKVGTVLLPPLTTAMEAVAVGAEVAAGAFDTVTSTLKPLGDILGWVGERVGGVSDTFDGTVGKVTDDSVLAVRALDTVGEGATDMGDAFVKAGDRIVDTSAKTLDRLVGFADATISGYYDPLQLEAELLAANAETSAARRVIASGTATDAEIADARETLLNVGEDQARVLMKLAQAGKTGSRAYQDGIAGLEAQIAASSGPMRIQLQRVLAGILAVERAGAVVPINFQATFRTGRLTAMAHGGPVTKGEPYIVGDGGRPELFVPDSNGTILPSVPTSTGGGTPFLGGGGGGGGGTTVFNVTYSPTFGTASVSEMRAAAAALVPELTREMRRIGLAV